MFSFKPDFSSSIIKRTLIILTSQGPLTFHLEAKVPHEFLSVCIESQPAQTTITQGVGIIFGMLTLFLAGYMAKSYGAKYYYRGRQNSIDLSEMETQKNNVESTKLPDNKSIPPKSDPEPMDSDNKRATSTTSEKVVITTETFTKLVITKEVTNDKRQDETVSGEEGKNEPKSHIKHSNKTNDSNTDNTSDAKHKRTQSLEEHIPVSNTKSKKGSKRGLATSEEKIHVQANTHEPVPIPPVNKTTKIEETITKPNPAKSANLKSTTVQRKPEEIKIRTVNEAKSTPLLSIESTATSVINVKSNSIDSNKKEKILKLSTPIRKNDNETPITLNNQEKKDKTNTDKKIQNEQHIDNHPSPPQSRLKPAGVFIKKSDISQPPYRSNRPSNNRITKPTIVVQDKTGKRTTRYVPKVPHNESTTTSTIDNSTEILPHGISINPALLSNMPAIEYGGRQYRVLQKHDKSTTRSNTNTTQYPAVPNPTNYISPPFTSQPTSDNYAPLVQDNFESLFSTGSLFSFPLKSEESESAEPTHSFFSSTQSTSFPNPPIAPSYTLFASTTTLFPQKAPTALLISDDEDFFGENK